MASRLIGLGRVEPGLIFFSGTGRVGPVDLEVARVGSGSLKFDPWPTLLKIQLNRRNILYIYIIALL